MIKSCWICEGRGCGICKGEGLYYDYCEDYIVSYYDYENDKNWQEKMKNVVENTLKLAEHYNQRK